MLENWRANQAMTHRVDEAELRQHIGCWDEFVAQASEAAIRTYGVEYNNWALYIPALMAEINNSIATYVNDKHFDDKQMELNMDDEVTLETDEHTELSVHTRLAQLTQTDRTPQPGEQRVMDPFRRVAEQATGVTPDAWADDPDWNE